MNTRKIMGIMLMILAFLVLLIIIKAIDMNKENYGENVDNQMDANENIDDVVISEIESDVDYDKEEMYFDGYENIYRFFNTFEDGAKFQDYMYEALLEYGTPVRVWKVENIEIVDNTLSFKIISAEKISEEVYEVKVNSEKSTIIRIK